MSTLRIGYNLFKAPSQAGTYENVAGVIQVETAKQLAYKVRVQRVSDSFYWNATTGAYQAGAPAEADEVTIPGSDSDRGTQSSIRRLEWRPDLEICQGITAAGAIFTAYAVGDTPSGGVVMHLLETLIG